MNKKTKTFSALKTVETLLGACPYNLKNFQYEKFSPHSKKQTTKNFTQFLKNLKESFNTINSSIFFNFRLILISITSSKNHLQVGMK